MPAQSVIQVERIVKGLCQAADKQRQKLANLTKVLNKKQSHDEHANSDEAVDETAENENDLNMSKVFFFVLFKLFQEL